MKKKLTFVLALLMLCQVICTGCAEKRNGSDDTSGSTAVDTEETVDTDGTGDTESETTPNDTEERSGTGVTEADPESDTASETEPSDTTTGNEPSDTTTGTIQPTDTTSAATTTKKEDTEIPEEAVKTTDLVLAPGYWDCTSKTNFVGTDTKAQSYYSTRRFTKEMLPAGSTITIKKGIICEVEGWKKFPTAVSKRMHKSNGSDDVVVTVTSDWWGDCTSCAFNITSTGAKLTAEQAEKGFVIMVPEKAPDRRTYDWNADGVLSILTVGNSFSDDAMEYVYQIAKSAGVKKVYLGNLFYGACRLEWHYNFWTQNSASYEYRVNEDGKWETKKLAKFEEAFTYKKWDFISFQESAQEIQTNESLYTHLNDLINMAKKRCPNAKIVWHQPWANPHKNYGNSTQTMYLDCLCAARRIAESYGFDEIITTCTAIQNLRTSYIDNSTRILRDGWHLSLDLGRYTAGLTLFTQLTGISVKDLAYAPGGVSADEKKVAIEAAVNTAARPRIVTQSKYTSGPKPITEADIKADKNYKLLELEYVPGYWKADTSADRAASSSTTYLCTKYTFTKDTIPVGSYIVIDKGVNCRPEGWENYPNTVTTRAPFMTKEADDFVYKVPSDWYNTYTTRAFNLSVAKGSTKTFNDLYTAVRVYVPVK